MGEGSERNEESDEARTREDHSTAGHRREGAGIDAEPTPARPASDGRPGWLGWQRTIEVDGEPRPVASLLRRGAALAVDLCFAILAAALAIDALSFAVPLDTDQATGPILAIFAVLAVHILWLRDRGASHPGASLGHGLSVGRWLLGLRLVPVAGPRRISRPVTVADTAGAEGETMQIIRAVLLGVAASLVALLFLGHAVSRTVVFLTVENHAEQFRPFAAERGSEPELAAIPSALVVGRSRAYVRVDAEWGDRSDPLEFFLERSAGQWKVAEVRIGTHAWLRNYALSAPDAEVPVP